MRLPILQKSTLPSSMLMYQSLSAYLHLLRWVPPMSHSHRQPQLDVESTVSGLPPRAIAQVLDIPRITRKKSMQRSTCNVKLVTFAIIDYFF
ncbi:hypothetical protein LINPERPRIM_LOCUS39871 [Linum perenne]